MSDSYYLDSKLSTTSSFEDKEAIKNVSFVGKIHLMLKDPECIGHISWNSDGTQFFIVNIEKFSDQVLPRYFKHGNYASFVRILNKHGFHKIKSDAGEACFFHTHFKKNITNLAKVKRMNHQTAAVTYNTKRVQPIGTENRVSAEEFKDCQRQLQEMSENFKTMEAKTGALKDLVTDQSKMISLICKEIAILTSENESKLNTLLSQLTTMKRTETIKKEEQELAKSPTPNEWQSQSITKGRSRAFLNQTVVPLYEKKPTDPYNGQLLNEIAADVPVLSYNRKSKGTSENFPEQASKYDKEQEISDYYDLIKKKHKKENSPPINQKNGPGMPTSESSGDFFQTAVYGTNYDYDYYDEEHPYV